MKKIFVFLFASLFCLSLGACSLISEDEGIFLSESQKNDYYNGTFSTQSLYDSSYGIGRGINALSDKYVEVSSRYTPIFDSSKITSLKWIKTNIKEQGAEVISEVSAASFQSQLSAAYSKKTSASIGINGLLDRKSVV